MSGGTRRVTCLASLTGKLVDQPEGRQRRPAGGAAHRGPFAHRMADALLVRAAPVIELTATGFGGVTRATGRWTVGTEKR